MTTSGVHAFTKKELEEAENQRLAVYASRSLNARRKYEISAEGRAFDYRTEFQRDRDRIIHSKSFRRLKHKTQVFIPFEGDHYRTRLTHTLEATQLARTIARALNLNEDLTEACALGHDVGHTPFGHSGEKVLNRILTGQEKSMEIGEEVIRKVGAFKHNYQSVRVVDLLEKRYEHPGLNLTNETREGILKHTAWRRDFPFPDIDADGLNMSSGAHLEGQTVGWADEIAQQAHDLEDGMRLCDLERLHTLSIVKSVTSALADTYTGTRDPALRRALLIRGIIHLLVTDLIVSAQTNIERWLTEKRVTTPQEFHAHRKRLPGSLVSPSKHGERLFLELKEFIYQYIIHSHTVAQHDGRAQLVVSAVFGMFYKNPRLLPDDVLSRYRTLSGIAYLRDVPLKHVDDEIAKNYHPRPLFLRCIADHIAGMTDSYALGVYDSMYAPYPRHLSGLPMN